ncbi:hypothetical protein [Helicobacter labetoulli]|uniref:hypothetical protein n=1 Tax=Helicobacter labetoulli TaxID=2315333 RepID=UPI000EF6CEAC|nr:hypothetical protein [Helicobacter labetoulli]
MKIELGERLKVLAEANDGFADRINQEIEDMSKLKDYIWKASYNERIGFTKNDNTFLVETFTYTRPNNRLACELILSQILTRIDKYGDIHTSKSLMIESYSFEVHYGDKEASKALGYAWHVAESFAERILQK